jgi:hypothetical protein
MLARDMRGFLYDEFLLEERQDLACMFARLYLTPMRNFPPQIINRTDKDQKYFINRVDYVKMTAIDMSWQIYRERWRFDGWDAYEVTTKNINPKTDKNYTESEITAQKIIYDKSLCKWNKYTWPWTVAVKLEIESN